VNQEVILMATREASIELKALKAKVDDWRKRRGKRTRIPEELWAEAVTVAQIDGVWATSRAAHFRYPDLKERLRTALRVSVPAGKVVEPPGGGRANGATTYGGEAFVELSMDALGARTRTVVELVGRGGDRMRVEACGGVDLTGLARAFFGGDER
jgi:hypothetical protein